MDKVILKGLVLSLNIALIRAKNASNCLLSKNGSYFSRTQIELITLRVEIL
jgi:hypothetical protein